MKLTPHPCFPLPGHEAQDPGGQEPITTPRWLRTTNLKPHAAKTTRSPCHRPPFPCFPFQWLSRRRPSLIVASTVEWESNHHQTLAASTSKAVVHSLELESQSIIYTGTIAHPAQSLHISIHTPTKSHSFARSPPAASIRAHCRRAVNLRRRPVQRSTPVRDDQTPDGCL